MASNEFEESRERTLFVSNLHSDVTEDLLYELFLQAGPLNDVALKKTAKGSIAFVEFKHEESIPFVIALMNNIKLFDKPLSLKPRENTKMARKLEMAQRELDRMERDLRLQEQQEIIQQQRIQASMLTQEQLVQAYHNANPYNQQVNMSNPINGQPSPQVKASSPMHGFLPPAFSPQISNILQNRCYIQSPVNSPVTVHFTPPHQSGWSQQAHAQQQHAVLSRMDRERPTPPYNTPSRGRGNRGGGGRRSGNWSDQHNDRRSSDHRRNDNTNYDGRHEDNDRDRSRSSHHRYH